MGKKKAYFLVCGLILAQWQAERKFFIVPFSGKGLFGDKTCSCWVIVLSLHVLVLTYNK